MGLSSEESWASQVVLVVKNLPANAGDLRDLGSIPGSERSPGAGNGNPLQCSCLENSMDRVCGRKKSDTTEQLTHTSLDTFETMFEFLSLKLPSNFILILTLF